MINMNRNLKTLNILLSMSILNILIQDAYLLSEKMDKDKISVL